MKKEFIEFFRTRKKLNLLIVFINLAIFFLMEISGGDTTDAWYMEAHGAMYIPDILEHGEYYRLVTCMFLHFGIEHLAFNMLLLMFAGDMLIRQKGSFSYLLIYFLGGVAGNILSMAVHIHTDSYAISAGASGAIFAVMGALVFLVIRKKGKVPGLDGKGICMMAVLSLIQGFTESGVDQYAHLGGFVGGFVLASLLGILSSVRERKKR